MCAYGAFASLRVPVPDGDGRPGRKPSPETTLRPSPGSYPTTGRIWRRGVTTLAGALVSARSTALSASRPARSRSVGPGTRVVRRIPLGGPGSGASVAVVPKWPPSSDSDSRAVRSSFSRNSVEFGRLVASTHGALHYYCCNLGLVGRTGPLEPPPGGEFPFRTRRETPSSPATKRTETPESVRDRGVAPGPHYSGTAGADRRRRPETVRRSPRTPPG